MKYGKVVLWLIVAVVALDTVRHYTWKGKVAPIIAGPHEPIGMVDYFGITRRA